jgi:AAA15 family ATPase/GTPase
MADKKFRLLSLEIENFQSITNPMRLDFSPITLLYGPNSAGKSAVFDALELLKLVFNPHQTSMDVLDELVSKWTHKPIESKEDEITNLKLAIEISPSPRDAIHDSYYGHNFSAEILNRTYQCIEYGDLLSDIFGNQKIRFEYQVRVQTHYASASLEKLSISATIKDELEDGDITERQVKILEVKARENIKSKDELEPPFLDVYLYLDEFTKNWTENFDSISNADFLKSEMNSDKIVGESGKVVGKEFCYGRFDPMSSSVYHADGVFRFNDDIKYAQFREAYIDYLSYFGGLLTNLLEEAFPLVKADRTIPTPDNTLVLNEGVDLENLSDDASDRGYHGKFRIKNYSIPKMLSAKFKDQEIFFKDLAYWSHFHKTYLSLKDSIYSDELDPEIGIGLRRHISPNSTELIQFRRVNKYLSDYLFLEKGYRIDSESEYLISADLLEDLSQDLIARCPAVTRVYLVDTAGRKLEIQDVGSGIAFVLPILVSISQHQISLIQQPELHLHPALQSSLAEVFIDRLHESNTDNFWQTIIETHSEHLLLRILRRIRETEQGRNAESNITNNDVAVYYFNPLPEGGTELRKMLITPLGDFYNTWPRGFFDERNKDIFDE